jgi:hypothetical protein
MLARLDGGRARVAVLLGQAWAPVMFLAGLSLLLFPDGRGPLRPVEADAVGVDLLRRRRGVLGGVAGRPGADLRSFLR